ncbi:MAG: hypothetical protein KatS3mg124_1443 [Porticoccaceae bacterium]|nr:MAG: hypothetical protein KatS3mg124_1443 [Porticoccaceae bacterium]
MRAARPAPAVLALSAVVAALLARAAWVVITAPPLPPSLAPQRGDLALYREGVQPAAVPARFSGRLLGVIAGDPGVAAFALADGRVAVVREGEPIAPDLLLERVEGRAAVVREGGVARRLALPGAAPDAPRAAQVVASPSLTAGERVVAVEGVPVAVLAADPDALAALAARPALRVRVVRGGREEEVEIPGSALPALADRWRGGGE